MNILYLSNLLIILPTIAAVCFAIAALALFFDEKRVKSVSISKSEYDTVSRQEEISKNVLEGLADGIVLIDATLSIPFMNSSAKKLLHIRNTDPTFLDFVNALPPTLDLKKRIQESLLQNKPFEQEIKLEEKSLKLFSTPIALGQEEKPGLIYLVVKDVTFDESLTQVKDDFVNMMIHELRAPITAVKGASEMLLAQHNKLNKEGSEKMIGLIHEQSGRLLDQVSSLLDLAKIQASKFTIQKTPSDVEKLINQVVEVFQIQARNKKIALTAKFDENIPKEVEIDPIRIGQVLNNLLSNSIKFTPEKGKITINASIIKGTPQNLSISVTDTGMGIPKDQQKELFTKFYEVADGKNAGSNSHVAGTGLGLFITKQIIDAHGGTINLQSIKDKGTTITFSIPLLTI